MVPNYISVVPPNCMVITTVTLMMNFSLNVIKNQPWFVCDSFASLFLFPPNLYFLIWGGSHPQAMSFFDGSFYSSQMLHPSQLQQGAPSSQSLPIQQQSQQNASLSTSSSSSQKHMQSQQIRPHGSSIPSAGNLNQGLQNFQATTKARTSQLHHEMGSEDSPSADSRTRPNTSVYGQNFAMPFHSPNFALITPPTLQLL